MTTFPGSPRVLKGALVSVDPLSPIPGVIIFQYNPDTLTRTLKPRAPGGDGARAEAQRLTGPPEETIKVDIEIDAADQLETGEILASTVGIYPLGTVLRLRSNRLAVVCGQNDNEPLRPRVMTFFSVSESSALTPQVVDLTQSEDTVVAFEDARRWGYSDEQLMAMYAPHG